MLAASGTYGLVLVPKQWEQHAMNNAALRVLEFLWGAILVAYIA